MSAAITPQLIKELRDKTGVGIGKCKEALKKTDGDVNKAVDHLRKTGMATAIKKEGRSAKEGQIVFVENDDCVVICEINAETDFVVKNERFQEFSKDIANEIAASKPADINSFLSQKFSKDQNLTIDEYRATLIQAIGENIQIKRFQIFEKNADKSIGIYSHLGGKIITITEISGSNTVDQLARDIAMHTVASHPEYINPEQVPNDVIEHEKEIAKTQMQGKPEHIIGKILDGRIAKFFDEVCLLRQTYVRDESLKIQDLIDNTAKETGKPLTITAFTRWSVGQN